MKKKVKNKGGRPFGTFQGVEKKITKSIKIEPRFHAEIVLRYGSFQMWFDSQVKKEIFSPPIESKQPNKPPVIINIVSSMKDLDKVVSKLTK